MNIQIERTTEFTNYLKLNGYDETYIELIYNHAPLYKNIYDIYIHHYIKQDGLSKEVQKDIETGFNVAKSSSSCTS